MYMKSCEVCEFLPTIQPAYSLIEGDNWNANLRNNDQSLLGTSFVTAKQHVPELDYLTPVEDTEFVVIRNALIGAIRRSFNPLTFNISCLKNYAFVDPSVTPEGASHVHWHIKPRYRPGITSVNGEDFSDPMPGKYLEPSFYKRQVPTEDTAEQIANIIRSNL
jgi:diadenosine tetraphosphate (Ap4A) HIT family hydrolase